MAANEIKCQNIVSQIEGLVWHIDKLKSYEITDKSCAPEFICKSIKQDEQDLMQLQSDLSIMCHGCLSKLPLSWISPVNAFKK